MMEKDSVLVVTNIPNPYRIPLFNILARELARQGLRLVVAFGAETYARRKYKLDLTACEFEYHILKSGTIRLGDSEKTMFTYTGLLSLVRKIKPSAVIVTGFSLATMKLRLMRMVGGPPYAIWSGSVRRDGRFDSMLRILMRRLLVRGATACIAYGSKAAEYLLWLGANPGRVFNAINTVDTEFFINETDRQRVGTPPEGPARLLAIGYLVPRKRMSRLLDAIAALALKRSDFVLDLVGDGEDRHALETHARSLGLENIVRFHGYRQREELPQYLAQATCFLFQTDFDIWGLVLNEAMAAGLPCIASANAYAVYDLVQDGQTGYIVDYSDPEAVAKRIGHLLDHPEEAKAMGMRARDYIRAHASPAASVTGFTDAIRTLHGS